MVANSTENTVSWLMTLMDAHHHWAGSSPGGGTSRKIYNEVFKVIIRILQRNAVRFELPYCCWQCIGLIDLVVIVFIIQAIPVNPTGIIWARSDVGLLSGTHATASLGEAVGGRSYSKAATWKEFRREEFFSE